MKKILRLSIIALCVNNTNAQWQKTNGTNGQIIECFAISGSNIFAGAFAYEGLDYLGGVFLSIDAGINWTSVNNGMPAKTNVVSLAISGNNIFAGTSIGIFLSTNN